MTTPRKVSSRGRINGDPNPIDKHVGARIKLRRALLGMSQEKLGEALGLTFQQVQKYERGANRVGASRLFDLSRVLDVPVSFFFDDMAEEVAAASPATNPTVAPTFKVEEPTRQELILMRNFKDLNPNHKTAVANLITALVETN